MKDLQIGEYLVTTDKACLSVTDIHAWLSTEAYWCKGIPVELVRTAFEHSFVCGVIFQERTVGYARLVTDYATFGYLADVFVTAAHRGQGLSKALMRVMISQPWVPRLRRLMLATQDAHGLYEQFGFAPITHPERLMARVLPNPYESPTLPA